MSKDNTPAVVKKGNIGALDPNQKTQPLITEFLDHPKFQGNEVTYFGLGVDKSSVEIVYSSNIEDKTKAASIPKYYQDQKTGRLELYNDGEALREIQRQIIDTTQQMREKFGNQMFNSQDQRIIETQIDNANKRIEMMFNPDIAINAIIYAKDAVYKNQNLAMTEQLKQFQASDVGRQYSDQISFIVSDPVDKFKKNVDDLLERLANSDIRDDKINKLLSFHNDQKAAANYDISRAKALITDLNSLNNISPEESKIINHLNQDENVKLKTEIKNFVENTKNTLSNNVYLNAISRIDTQSVSAHLGHNGPTYSDLINEAKNSLNLLQNLNVKMEKMKTINYGLSTTSDNIYNPSERDFNKVYTNLVFQQEQITGISKSDKDFANKIAALDPKSLGKIEVVFKNSSNETATYVIDNKAFVKSLKKIENNNLLTVSNDLTLKAGDRTLTGCAITKDRLTNIISKSNVPDLNENLASLISTATIDIKFKSEQVLQKAGVDPIEVRTKVSDIEIFNNSNSSTEKSIKSLKAVGHAAIESVQLTFIHPETGKDVNITLDNKVFAQALESIYSEPASSVDFEKLNREDRVKAAKPILDKVEDLNFNKMFTEDKTVRSRSSKNKSNLKVTQTNSSSREANVKTELSNNLDSRAQNLVFPDQVKEQANWSTKTSTPVIQTYQSEQQKPLSQATTKESTQKPKRSFFAKLNDDLDKLKEFIVANLVTRPDKTNQTAAAKSSSNSQSNSTKKKHKSAPPSNPSNYQYHIGNLSEKEIALLKAIVATVDVHSPARPATYPPRKSNPHNKESGHGSR